METQTLNGLDDIGIAQYEDLIAAYENNDQSTGRIRKKIRKGNEIMTKHIQERNFHKEKCDI